MKFLIEINPLVEIKNTIEPKPDVRKKMKEARRNLKYIAAWFTLRRGFLIVKANSIEEITRKTASLF